MPVSVQSALRRLRRRLAIGLFLDAWPAWAVASLLVAGGVALVCRMFLPAAAPRLPWLWLAPVLAIAPALVMCIRRAYRPADVVALADALSGGRGWLLALHETNDPLWAGSPILERASSFPLPRVRPARKLAAVVPALAFLGIALWLPQRAPRPSNTAVADDIASGLTATVVELQQQQLVTPDDQKRLDEEIERIRRGAEDRVDGSSWEAADALREKLAADLSGKQDAVKWAKESLARYEAAVQAAATNPNAETSASAQAAELARAIENLAKSGLLAGAPPELRELLKPGKLPGDPKALGHLSAALSKYLAETNGRFGEIAKLGKEFGRFDPSEFPIGAGESSPDGDGDPGRGGINRGRGDAELTWGKETQPFDRFKAEPLPQGAARSADDWAPIDELPGAPKTSPEASVPASATQYAAAAGQSAWRRTLAPRHQSAVKKYFAK